MPRRMPRYQSLRNLVRDERVGGQSDDYNKKLVSRKLVH